MRVRTIHAYPTSLHCAQLIAPRWRRGTTPNCFVLTHWGRVTHICVGKLTNIGSDLGLSPGRREAIIWTNAGILSIGRVGAKFSEVLIEVYTFSLKKMHVKMSSGKWRPFCLGLNVLTPYELTHPEYLFVFDNMPILPHWNGIGAKIFSL